MARYKYQGTFTDQAGNIIDEGTVSVFLAGTSTVASVYEADSGGSAVNSVESDSEGYFAFWVDDGDYNSNQEFKIELSKSLFVTQEYDEIAIYPFASAGYVDTLKSLDIITKGPYLDVRAFGAIGDGVTDDTVAIQATYDALPSTGGTVFIPEGRHYITSAIAGTKNSVRFLGVGTSGFITGTSEVFTDQSIILFDIGSASATNHNGPIFENISLADDGGTALGGVRLRRMNHARFLNCAAHQFTVGYGISMDGTGDACVDTILTGFENRACKFGIRTVKGHSINIFGGDFLGTDISGGIGVDAAASKTHLYGVHFDGWVTGVQMSEPSGAGTGGFNKVLGCNFENGHTAGTHIHIQGGARNTIVYNSIGSADNDGIVIDNYADTHNHQIGPNSYFSISGAKFTDNTDYNTYSNWIYEPELNTLQQNNRITGYIESSLRNSSQGALDGSRWVAKANRDAIQGVLGADVTKGPFLGSLTAHDVTWIRGGTTACKICSGSGSPEGSVTAPISSIYFRTDGGAGTSFYIKESGAGNTGWVSVDRDSVAETVTSASPTLSVQGSTSIDSNSNAVDGTLGSGEYIGQTKTIVMTEASNSSTISITNHQTSDPEIATFDAVDETGVFLWSGTEWVTLFATCTFV